MSISNYLEDKLLDLTFRNATFPPITAVYASLHTANPGETGTGSPLASCPRFAVTFNAAASATSVLAAAASVVASATGDVTHIALWDGSSTNTANCLWYGALTQTKTVANVGDTVQIASAGLTVSLD